MRAVPKAQFRLGMGPPSDHPHAPGQDADTLIPLKQVRLRANPCAGSADGVATLSGRAVLNSRGCLRPIIVMNSSCKTHGSGGNVKAPHPWLVVHTSGRVCSVSSHPWSSLTSTPRQSKDPLNIMATEWEAVWEAKQAGAHFFVHSATGHTQWEAPPHDSTGPVTREGGQRRRPSPSSEQLTEDLSVHPTCERAHSIPARQDRVERRPLNNKRARKNVRSNETD